MGYYLKTFKGRKKAEKYCEEIATQMIKKLKYVNKYTESNLDFYMHIEECYGSGFLFEAFRGLWNLLIFNYDWNYVRENKVSISFDTSDEFIKLRCSKNRKYLIEQLSIMNLIHNDVEAIELICRLTSERCV